MPQPQWVVNQPPPTPTPEPVAFNLVQNADGSISLIGAIQDASPVTLLTLFAPNTATPGIIRQQISTASAQQLGVLLDSSGKLATN